MSEPEIVAFEMLRQQALTNTYLNGIFGLLGLSVAASSSTTAAVLDGSGLKNDEVTERMETLIAINKKAMEIVDRVYGEIEELQVEAIAKDPIWDELRQETDSTNEAVQQQ